LFTTKFSSARQIKNLIELFSTFLDESRESKMENLKKKTNKNPLFNRNIFTDEYYPSGYFPRTGTMG